MDWDADQLVALQSGSLDKYKLNFLKQVVCELRFPTLMELAEAHPPAALVSALRKEYPHMELASQVAFGVGAATGASNVHIFRSPKLTWTVSLSQSSLSIETTSYTSYAQMRERVLYVVAAASKIIDSDFFTRVGLRYINVIESNEDPRDGWVNSALTMPIMSDAFNGVKEYAGKLHLAAEDGGCLLQHGLRPLPVGKDGHLVPPEYLVDIDSYRNMVDIKDTSDALDAMHSQVFNVFDWSLGSKSRDYLTKVKS